MNNKDFQALMFCNSQPVIDPQIKKWVEQTKRYTELGYNNRAGLWSPESIKNMTKTGKVFGYFGPAWVIDFVLTPNSLEDPKGEKKLGNGSYGDWAFCKGPQPYEALYDNFYMSVMEMYPNLRK